MAEDAEQNGAAPPSARTPPYTAFKTMLTLIDDLKTVGLPPQIDRSVLTRFSGGVGSQLIHALKSLGLTDEQNRPTTRLKTWVDTFGTEDFKPVLRETIQTSYPFLAGLDLTTATPSMFAEAFKGGTNAKEEVLRKCRTFYLHAAQMAEIPIGQRLLTGSVPRSPRPSSGAGRRRAKAPRQQPDAAAHTVNGSKVHGDSRVRQRKEPLSYTEKLLDKFPKFDPSWSPEIQASWFAGFKELMASSPDKAGSA